MSTRHLSDEEIAIIERLPPESLRLFFKRLDPGLNIQQEDAEHLRKRLLNAPPESLFANLKAASLMEVEGIFDRQLEERVSRMKKEWAELRDKESTITTILNHVSQWQVLFTAFITIASIAAGYIGYSTFQEFTTSKTKTDELRQLLVSDRKNVRKTLQQLTIVRLLSIDAHLREVMENHIAVLVVPNAARVAIDTELTSLKGLVHYLEPESETNPSRRQNHLDSLNVDESEEQWKRLLKALRLVVEFTDQLMELGSNEQPDLSTLNVLEERWERLLRDLEKETDVPAELAKPFSRIKSYCNHLVGNIHLSRWRGHAGNEVDLQNALRYFEKASALDEMFWRPWNNIGIIRVELAVRQKSGSVSENYERASDAYARAARLHKDPGWVIELNHVSCKLFQNGLSQLRPAPKESGRAAERAMMELDTLERSQVNSHLLFTRAEATIMKYLADFFQNYEQPLPPERLEGVRQAIKDARSHFKGSSQEEIRKRADLVLLNELDVKSILRWEEIFQLLDIKTKAESH